MWLSATPQTIAHQAPLSMGFSRQEYWSGLPFPSPGDLPDPGIKPRSPDCRQILYHLSHQGSPFHDSAWSYSYSLQSLWNHVIGFMTSHHKNEEMRLCIFFANILSVHFFIETSYEIPTKVMFYTHFFHSRSSAESPSLAALFTSDNVSKYIKWSATHPFFRLALPGCAIFILFMFFMLFLLLFMKTQSFLWRRQWQPTPILLPGKSHGRRSLVGCSPWGH